VTKEMPVIYIISDALGETAEFVSRASEAFVLDYLLNQEAIKHNLEVAKLNKETSIEVSKNQKITADKYEL
jgi:regulator of PEP synthase PpsR (kinase-PPPase family)